MPSEQLRRQPLNRSERLVLDLLADHGRELLGVLLRITLREDVAEDLLQELFLRLHDQKAFARSSNPKAYALRTAMRLAFDWRRAQARRKDTDSLNTDPASSSENNCSHLELREDLQTILDDISRLSKTSRETIVMRYLEEKSYEEIAETLGKSAHQVRALCSKAIARLREFQEI